MNPRSTTLFLLLPMVLLLTVFQAGCGSTPPASTDAPTVVKSATSSHSRTPAVKPPPMDLPKEVLAELERNIKEWADKKGHSIKSDKSGKIVVKTAKGRKAKIPVGVFPSNDKLPKAVVEQMEVRTKEWAEMKGYTTDRNKQGLLVGKNTKGKNVKPPFDIFLSTLPDGMFRAAATADAATASDSADAEEDGDDETDD